MKTTRLVIGIVSMVLFIIISFQSCAVGLGNALLNNEDTSGAAGIFLAFCMLVAGIVAVAARSSKSASIVAGCFYGLGGLIGVINVGTYSDLMIWSIISFVFAAVLIITGIVQKNEVTTNNVADGQDNTPQ